MSRFPRNPDPSNPLIDLNRLSRLRSRGPNTSDAYNYEYVRSNPYMYEANIDNVKNARRGRQETRQFTRRMQAIQRSDALAQGQVDIFDRTIIHVPRAGRTLADRRLPNEPLINPRRIEVIREAAGRQGPSVESLIGGYAQERENMSTYQANVQGTKNLRESRTRERHRRNEDLARWNANNQPEESPFEDDEPFNYVVSGIQSWELHGKKPEEVYELFKQGKKDGRLSHEDKRVLEEHETLKSVLSKPGRLSLRMVGKRTEKPRGTYQRQEPQHYTQTTRQFELNYTPKGSKEHTTIGSASVSQFTLKKSAHLNIIKLGRDIHPINEGLLGPKLIHKLAASYTSKYDRTSDMLDAYRVGGARRVQGKIGDMSISLKKFREHNAKRGGKVRNDSEIVRKAWKTRKMKGNFK